MPTCNICIDNLKDPVALPCGHVFCVACIARAVNTITPPTSLQPCPTCRSIYSIVHVSPSMIPGSIRPHVVPSLRRLYLEEEPNTQSSSSGITSPSAAVSECGRLTAENRTLRVNCALWKRRAELHAAATCGLLNLARMTRECNEKLKRDNEELQRQCNLLKRKLEVEESLSFPVATATSDHYIPPKSAPDALPQSSSEQPDRGSAAFLTAACIPYPYGQLSVPSAVSRREVVISTTTLPLEQNLPPSLKRRKTSHSNPDPIKSTGDPEQHTAPRRSLRGRKSLVS